MTHESTFSQSRRKASIFLELWPKTCILHSASHLHWFGRKSERTYCSRVHANSCQLQGLNIGRSAYIISVLSSSLAPLVPSPPNPKQHLRHICNTVTMSNSSDRAPAADLAEDNAWFPSPYSLTQYVPPKTDFDGADYPNKYTGGKWKILLIATQERYLQMADGKFFSTGNHPVEMLLPVLHLDAAGFEIDIATVSGDPVKFEMWAFPKEDEAVKAIHEKYKAKLRAPLSLQKVWGDGFTKDTPYIGVFIPGGHGVMNGVPFSPTVGSILRWANAEKRYLITLCHGPASMLAAGVGKPEGSDFIYKGYKICVFPDSLDTGANIDIGYIPGKMPWLVGEALKKQGVEIVNPQMTGETHQDRYVLTGDSPLASNGLGKLAAKVLLEDVAQR